MVVSQRKLYDLLLFFREWSFVQKEEGKWAEEEETLFQIFPSVLLSCEPGIGLISPSSNDYLPQKDNSFKTWRHKK